MSLMQVSRRVDYALRAAIHLARLHGQDAASVTEISENEGVPRKFLEKILQDLSHCDLVVSRRGAHGGYRLARDPSEISFREVMEAVDGPLALNVCVGGGDHSLCSVSTGCGMQHVWAEGQRRLVELFTSTRLADFAGSPPLSRSISSSSTADA